MKHLFSILMQKEIQYIDSKPAFKYGSSKLMNMIYWQEEVSNDLSIFLSKYKKDAVAETQPERTSKDNPEETKNKHQTREINNIKNKNIKDML